MRWLAFTFAAIGLATLTLTVAGRSGFAWPLEWMERETLVHALRWFDARPLYAPPTAEFVPFLYPPFAYVPMALSAWLFGPTLPAARVPSLVALAGTLLLLGRVGTAEARASQACPARGDGVRPQVHTMDRASALAAGALTAGIFAAGYGYTGAFLDLARVDGVFVLLLAAGTERMLAGCTGTALALFAGSAFTKQHGGLFLFAASAWLLVHDTRRHLRPVAFAWGITAILYAWASWTTDGWFHRYVLALPASHRVEPQLLATFFVIDVGVYLPVVALTAAIVLARSDARRGALAPLLVAGLVAGALGRAHPGGHDNVRLPAFLMLVIIAVPPLARAMLGSAGWPTGAAAAFALALQLAILWQPPSAHKPPPESAPAFAAMSRALATCAQAGPRAALDHVLPGTTHLAHTMALSDVLSGSDRALATMTSGALLDHLRGPDAPQALLVGERFAALDTLLGERYRECARLKAPRLATGFTPGSSIDGELSQIVYVRAAPPRP